MLIDQDSGVSEYAPTSFDSAHCVMNDGIVAHWLGLLSGYAGCDGL